MTPCFLILLYLLKTVSVPTLSSFAIWLNGFCESRARISIIFKSILSILAHPFNLFPTSNLS